MSFLVNGIEDTGEELYRASDAETALDRPAHVGKALRVYLLALAAGFLVWFVFTFVRGVMRNGFADALLTHLSGLIILAAIEAILLLTAFSAWGKFTRFSLRHGYVRRNADSAALAAEISEADANKPRENALRVYENCVVIINRGVKRIIDRRQLSSVHAEIGQGTMQLSFYSSEGEFLAAFLRLPEADLPRLRTIFKEISCDRTQPSGRRKGRGETALLFIVSLVFVGFGVGMIALHYTIAEEIPVLLGCLFIAFGLLPALASLQKYAFGKAFLLPAYMGFLFTFFPTAVLFLISEEGIGALLLQPFSWTAVLVLFAAIGPVLIVTAFRGLIVWICGRK